MKKNTKVAVYGTLRKGEYNWARLLDGKSVYLGTYETDPIYTMYSNGGFPIVIDKGITSITYEVYEVDDDVLRSLNRLEGCTGVTGHPENWDDVISIETPVGKALMYVMHKEQDLEIIENGDWINN